MMTKVNATHARGITLAKDDEGERTHTRRITLVNDDEGWYIY
jgi:hypothetical protein